jgi:hypothetical protein
MTMKVRNTSVAFAVLALAMATQAWAQQSRQIAGEMIEKTGVVEAIDHGARVLTVRESSGAFETLYIPASAERFDEVKIGDAIQVRYYDNVAVRVKPASEPAVNSSSADTTPAAGGRLGGTVSTQRTITATVAAIDRGTRAVTYTGPNGFKYSRRVGESVNLDEFDVGDRIDVTWTEAVQIAINP